MGSTEGIFLGEGWGGGGGGGGGGVNATKTSLLYKFSSVFLIHIHCSIKLPAYFISSIKQKHVLIIIAYFGANNCHVHVSYINNMCLIPWQLVSCLDINSIRSRNSHL